MQADSDGIVEVMDGEVITENGAYSMSMDWYHSQCCAGPSFSSTGLRTVYLESPADFWAYSELNDERFEREGSEQKFVVGRAAHAIILGDEVFHDRYAVVPATAPPRPMSSQILARQRGNVSAAARERFEFWDAFEAENAGKDFLSETDLGHIIHIADNLKRHELMPLLMEGAVEQSLVWKDEQTGLWLKSRLDILSSTGDFADLKSTAHKKPGLLKKAIREHGYDMQVGLATMGLEAVKGIEFSAEAYASRAAVLIFVAKTPPYHVMPIEIDTEAIYRGRLKCRHAINRIARCIEEDYWPGPIEGIDIYTPPQWEIDLMTELQEAGEFPLNA